MTNFNEVAVTLEAEDDMRIKEELEENKNKNFIQWPLASEAKELKSASSLVLFISLIEIIFNEKYPSMTETAYCVVGLDTLVSQTGLTKKTIISCTKDLVTNEWIKVHKCGQTNVYAVNPTKAWRSTSTMKHRALYNKKNLTGYIVRGNIVINNKQEDKDYDLR